MRIYCYSSSYQSSTILDNFFIKYFFEKSIKHIYQKTKLDKDNYVTRRHSSTSIFVTKSVRIIITYLISIVEKQYLGYIASKRIDAYCVHPKLLWSLMTATFPRSCTCCLWAWVDPCVCYIRVHVRILIPPRQLLARLLALVAWLVYRILTHIHVHRHAAAHKLLWLGYPHSKRSVLSTISDLPKKYRYPELQPKYP